MLRLQSVRTANKMAKQPVRNWERRAYIQGPSHPDYKAIRPSAKKILEQQVGKAAPVKEDKK